MNNLKYKKILNLNTACTAKLKQSGGFVTMFSVLIFGTVALVIASSVLLIGLGSSRTGFIVEQSAKAKYLASLCAESALQEIRNSTPFVGTNTINIGMDSCSYTVTNNGAQKRTITASGTVRTTVRKILITIDKINPAINVTLWQEVI